MAVSMLILGLCGIILPVLPGVALIFLGMVFYGYAEGFSWVNTGFLLLMLSLTLLCYILDYGAALLGVKGSGASRSGTIGAFLGGIIGMFIFPPFGLILGPIGGALLGELLVGRQPGQAARAGFGALAGMLAGTIVKLIIGVSMLILFIARIRA